VSRALEIGPWRGGFTPERRHPSLIHSSRIRLSLVEHVERLGLVPFAATAFKSMALASSAVPYWPRCCANAVDENARITTDAAAARGVAVLSPDHMRTTWGDRQTRSVDAVVRRYGCRAFGPGVETEVQTILPNHELPGGLLAELGVGPA
jgi:hypothetical protein